jgi:thiamine-monophosphate kinase
MPDTAFHEFDWIRRLRAATASGARVPLGIGDDAAVVRVGSNGNCLVTTDMLMEGTDFLFAETPWNGPELRRASPEEAGRKTLAVNLSDIAAMAGIPTAAFVAVALPRDRSARLADGLLSGIQTLAREFDVVLAGGDTNVWDGPLVVSITLLGEPTERGPVRRSGARPGDWLIATGAFGGSLLGRHLLFTPRVREGLALHAAAPLHALIDVSDGLAQDAGHLARESGVGLRLEADAIPIHSDARAMSRTSGRSPLEHALTDGEDFELLAAIPAEAAQTLLANPPAGLHLTQIGEFTAEPGIRLRTVDGSESPLATSGWVHGQSQLTSP